MIENHKLTIVTIQGVDVAYSGHTCLDIYLSFNISYRWLRQMGYPCSENINYTVAIYTIRHMNHIQ